MITYLEYKYLQEQDKKTKDIVIYDFLNNQLLLSMITFAIIV